MITITKDHIYINDAFDLAPFVDRKSIQVDGDRVTVVLLGKVIDGRGAEPEPEKVEKEKKVTK